MKKIIFKKVLSISLISLLSFSALYVVVEPVVVSALTATDSIVVTLTVDSGITISTGSDVTMSPNLGVTSDTSTGSSSWIVKTNHATGYTLGVKASTSPALASGSNSFADYTEATAGTPDLWTLATGAKEFGYSAYGDDVPDATWGTGSSCGSGATIPTDLKYVGTKITDKVIATRNSVTPTAGITTNICFAAAQKDVYAPSGTYTATITATATEI